MRRRGFTVIEVLFVVVLIAVLSAVIYPYLRSFHTGWQSADRRSEVVQNARVGMDKMVRDIRQAASFVSIQSAILTFIDVDNNVITYQLNGGDLLRSSASLAILAASVGDLTFTYFDAAGVETAVKEDVKSVKISITVSDAEGVVDSLSFISTAFMRSAVTALGEGYQLSKNSDFSTSDNVFSASDTFYVKAWSDRVNYNNLDYATCEIKKGGLSTVITLTNHSDGTYNGSQSLSGFSTGIWTINIDIRDNNTPAVRYQPTPSPTITIE